MTLDVFEEILPAVRLNRLTGAECHRRADEVGEYREMGYEVAGSGLFRGIC